MENSRKFLRVLDDKGEFSIVVCKHVFEEEGEEHYFEPNFFIGSDKIVRSDIIWERRDVLGYRSKGFKVATEDEFKEYCREKFKDVKDEVCINPFAELIGKKEPEYPDEEITKTEFCWR